MVQKYNLFININRKQKMSLNGEVVINYLPDLVLLHIFGTYLFRELGKNTQVCKRFYQIIKSISPLRTYYSCLTTVNLVAWAQTQIKLPKNFMNSVIAAGDVDDTLLKWCHYHHYIAGDVSAYAAKHGRIDLIKKLKQYGYKFHYNTFPMGAVYGRVDFMEFLCNEGCKYNMGAFLYAITHHKIEILKWLFERYEAPFNFVDLIASFGKNEEFEFAQEKGFQMISDDVYLKCIDIGNFVGVKWLVSHGYTVKPDTLHNAARYPKILHFLVEIGCKIYAELFCGIVKTGVLEEIKWAISNGSPVNTMSFVYAIRHDNREILELLFEKCPFAPDDNNIKTAITIAQNHGKLESLKWFAEKGCCI